MDFNYYYGNQADLFNFIRIPKVMLTDAVFSDLSLQAKVLYSVLLDRMALSRKNGWFDEENRVFIIYQIGEIQEDLGFTKRKAMDLLTELEKFGLLEKKRRGHGLPNILYVKSFMSGLSPGNDLAGASGQSEMISRSTQIRTSGLKSTDSRSADSAPLRSAGFRTLEVQNPVPLEVQNPVPLEVQKSAPLKSKTDINQTEKNHIKSNHIRLPAQESLSDNTAGGNAMRYDVNPSFTVGLAEEYRQLIHDNIEYDALLRAHPLDQDLIDGIEDLILETVLCRTEHILIASNSYPAEVVKSKFLKLGYWHIEYVISCLCENTTKIRNIKKYLLAALFNAPATINSYYTAEANYDTREIRAAR